MNKPIVKTADLKPGNIVRLVGYEDDYFFDFVVCANDSTGKIKFARPYATVTTIGRPMVAMEIWELPYTSDFEWYLLSEGMVYKPVSGGEK